MWTYDPLRMRTADTTSFVRSTMGSLSGTQSSCVATRIVPCTGGASLSVSRTTASSRGSASSDVM